MNRRLLAFNLLLLLALAPGCMLGRGKSEKAPKPPKESKVPAQEMADGFKKRWTDKRVAELVAQGSTAEAAQARATQEFTANFEYLAPARK